MFWDDFAETDWFLQDNPHRPHAVNDYNPERDFGWYFKPGRDAKAEQQMIGRERSPRSLRQESR